LKQRNQTADTPIKPEPKECSYSAKRSLSAQKQNPHDDHDCREKDDLNYKRLRQGKFNFSKTGHVPEYSGRCAK
jgi:hypothetical protein